VPHLLPQVLVLLVPTLRYLRASATVLQCPHTRCKDVLRPPLPVGAPPYALGDADAAPRPLQGEGSGQLAGHAGGGANLAVNLDRMQRVRRSLGEDVDRQQNLRPAHFPQHAPLNTSHGARICRTGNEAPGELMALCLARRWADVSDAFKLCFDHNAVRNREARTCPRQLARSVIRSLLALPAGGDWHAGRTPERRRELGWQREFELVGACIAWAHKRP
jgi:hypothetical protein